VWLLQAQERATDVLTIVVRQVSPRATSKRSRFTTQVRRLAHERTLPFYKLNVPSCNYGIVPNRG
jgi:hypothetical protein